ncbi:MAG TPA: hypothetical protein VN739_02220 [Nitrososphaerales archaeon]|nr:hypothetical protein [Nitrososphaerales archaeon]
MIIGFGSQGGGSLVWTPGASFALILGSSPGNPRVNAECQIVSGAQNRLAVSVTSTSSNRWTWLGDAIQGA